MTKKELEHWKLSGIITARLYRKSKDLDCFQFEKCQEVILKALAESENKDISTKAELITRELEKHLLVSKELADSVIPSVLMTNFLIGYVKEG